MIIYLNLCQPHKHPNDLEKKIRRTIPRGVQYLHNLEELGQRLQSPVYDIDLMIINICSISPISELIKYQNDLKDLSVVLILNDITSDERIAQLLRFYPRYITFSPDDGTILSVLRNRIKYKHPQPEEYPGKDKRRELPEILNDGTH